jgi:DNA topoisomerase-1
MDLERENNKLGKKCPNCDEGELTIKFTPRFRSYFIACTAYPDCRQTYSLPKGLIKNEAKKECEECGWPMILRIMQGKRPWVFCFNPDCASRQKKEEEPIPDNERVISE